MSDTIKYVLDETHIPKHWYNLLADLSVLPPPVLHPGTLKPVGADDLAPLFPMSGERHVRRAVGEYVAPDHLERNHQGLGNALIAGAPPRTTGPIRRRPRLGGLLNYYKRAA